MKLRCLVALLALTVGCSKKDEPKEKSKPAAVAAPAPTPNATAEPEAREDRRGTGNARFRVEGQWTAATTDAMAHAILKGTYLDQVQLMTTSEYRRKERLSFVVTFDLPAGFEPRPGTFTISPEYARRGDVVAARIMVHTDFIEHLTADPSGELVLQSVTPTQISGSFKFEVHDKAFHVAERQVKTVTVSGNFVAATQQAP